MRKPRKPDDLDWMNKCLTWVSMTEKWSSYLNDIAIPCAYDDARVQWAHADAESDESHVLSSGFKVYALLVLTRRINSYRRLISGKIRFPFTNTDAFSLLTRLEINSESGGENATQIARTLRRVLEDHGGTGAAIEVSDLAVAYCRNFLAWEKSMPRLGANRECTRCGSCCTDLWDAYNFTAAERDVLLWSLRGRWDIIEKMDWGIWHCWHSPEAGRLLSECPWLSKNRDKTASSCRINEVKPRHCRNWRGCPKGKPGHSVEKALHRAQNKGCFPSSTEHRSS
jgi:hypothetical protein